MFKKFFKGGNNDFYLEMEEESKDTPSKPAQSPTGSNGNGAKSAVAAPTPETKPVQTEQPKAAEVATTKTATQESGTTRKKTFRQSKVAKKEETAPATTPVTAPAPPPAPISPKDLEENKNTFAPKYLIPTSTNGRRRPGPNMNSFLEMASQVKINPSKNTIKPKTIASSKAPTPVVTEAPEKSKSKAKAKAKTSEKSETATPAETTN